MRTFIYWDNDVEGIPALPVGTPMYWLREVGGTCEEDRAAFNALSASQKIAQSSVVSPSTTTSWIPRSCVVTTDWVPSDDTPPVFVLDDPTNPDTPTNPTDPSNPSPTPTNPGTGGQIPSNTEIAYANGDKMRLRVEWGPNGLARLVDELASLGVDDSNRPWYFISGSVGLNGLPTTYDFYPGEDLTVIKIVSPAANSWIFQVIYKPIAWAMLTLGPAPV